MPEMHPQNLPKIPPKSTKIALKSDKKTTSQASCLASLSKTHFLQFLAPKRIPKIHQNPTTSAANHWSESLLSASGRHLSLRSASGTILYRFGEDLDRFWSNLGPILDNFWNIKPFKEQHHITWHTYIHTCIHFATTNRLGQAECPKRLNNGFAIGGLSKLKKDIKWYEHSVNKIEPRTPGLSEGSQGAPRTLLRVPWTIFLLKKLTKLQ